MSNMGAVSLVADNSINTASKSAATILLIAAPTPRGGAEQNDKSIVGSSAMFLNVRLVISGKGFRRGIHPHQLETNYLLHNSRFDLMLTNVATNLPLNEEVAMADDVEVTRDGKPVSAAEAKTLKQKLKEQLEREARTMGGGGATPAIHARTGVSPE